MKSSIVIVTLLLLLAMVASAAPKEPVPWTTYGDVQRVDRCLPDVTRDGVVGGADFGMVSAEWLTNSTDPGWLTRQVSLDGFGESVVPYHIDVNQDDVVGAADSGIMGTHWLKFCPQSVAIIAADEIDGFGDPCNDLGGHWETETTYMGRKVGTNASFIQGGITPPFPGVERSCLLYTHALVTAGGSAPFIQRCDADPTLTRAVNNITVYDARYEDPIPTTQQERDDAGVLWPGFFTYEREGGVGSPLTGRQKFTPFIEPWDPANRQVYCPWNHYFPTTEAENPLTQPVVGGLWFDCDAQNQNCTLSDPQ